MLVAAVAGCAPVADMKTLDTSVPSKDSAVNGYRSESDVPAVVVLQSEPNEFWTFEYDRGDKLPMTPVGPVKAENVPVDQLLDMVASSIGIGIVKSDDLLAPLAPPDPTAQAGAQASIPSISYLDPRKRPLADLVEAICERTGLFYEYRNGMLSIERSRRFSVRVPRVGTSQDMFASAFEKFGAKDVFKDQVTGVVSFTADHRVYRAARDFMRKFENGHDMLMFDIWVFERKLNDGNEVGAYLNKLTTRTGAPVTWSLKDTITSASTLQVGVVAALGNKALDMALALLHTEGATETIQRPNVALMSGGTTDFSVGEKQQYISKITIQNVANTTTTNQNTTTTTPQQSVDVDTLETGIKLTIKAAHNDGIINSELKLSLNTLIQFKDFDTGQVKLSLPHTANRDVKTAVDARPGDLIVLAGLIQGIADEKTNGFIKGLPLTRVDSRSKAETIMLIRPRLVKIRPASAPVLPGEVVVRSGQGRLDELPPEAPRSSEALPGGRSVQDLGSSSSPSKAPAPSSVGSSVPSAVSSPSPVAPAPSSVPGVVARPDPWWGGSAPETSGDRWRRRDSERGGPSSVGDENRGGSGR
jgi:hypothetical protein